MQNLFSGCACRVRSLLVCAHRFFLCCPVNSRGAHAGIFFYLFCPVTSPLLDAAQHFSWTFLLCPRTSHACVSGAQIFPVQSLPAAARTFFFSPTLLPCDRSLCHPRSKDTFFLLPCSSVRDTGRAELFFYAVLFLFLSGLICADTWFCFFFLHGISAVHFFRILRQKFEFFGIFPLLFLVL
jgi:hypothetical protein